MLRKIANILLSKAADKFPDFLKEFRIEKGLKVHLIIAKAAQFQRILALPKVVRKEFAKESFFPHHSARVTQTILREKWKNPRHLKRVAQTLHKQNSNAKNEEAREQFKFGIQKLK